MTFFTFLKRWWTSTQKKQAFFCVLSLILIGIVDVCANFAFAQWQKFFYDALEQKDMSAFLHQLCMFVPVAGLVLVSFVGGKFLKDWAGFSWRRWMTAHLQQQWIFTRGYYKLSLGAGNIDNPDQRIAQDAKEVTEKTVKLFAIFFKDGLNFITFSIILWGMSANLDFLIPGFLLWSAVLYAVLAIVLTFKIGRPLIQLDQNQEKSEANFRYQLVRILEKKEEIAKLSGETYESAALDLSFQEIGVNFMNILRQKAYLNTTEILHGQGNMFVPLLLVAPLYFKGVITLGVLMQIRFIFYEVYRSLSSCAYEYHHIANLRASLNRLVDFSSTIDALQEKSAPLKGENLELKDIEIFTPLREHVWSVSSVCLKRGEKKTLQAPSGTGKTSLLRVIAGIYPFYTGQLCVPHPLMIIPQRAYLPLGTLREILSYPCLDVAPHPQEVMDLCGLGHLKSALDERADYHQILSAGEQQRINFVRVLLARPSFLIMDEPVSALDEAAALELMLLLKERLIDSGILLLSHSPVQGFETI